jgi:hypothetical protein
MVALLGGLAVLALQLSLFAPGSMLDRSALQVLAGEALGAVLLSAFARSRRR